MSTLGMVASSIRWLKRDVTPVSDVIDKMVVRRDVTPVSPPPPQEKNKRTRAVKKRKAIKRWIFFKTSLSVDEHKER